MLVLCVIAFEFGKLNGYMNGDGFGKGPHLSRFFFVMMRGYYDAFQT